MISLFSAPTETMKIITSAFKKGWGWLVGGFHRCSAKVCIYFNKCVFSEMILQKHYFKYQINQLIHIPCRNKNKRELISLPTGFHLSSCLSEVLSSLWQTKDLNLQFFFLQLGSGNTANRFQEKQSCKDQSGLWKAHVQRSHLWNALSRKKRSSRFYLLNRKRVPGASEADVHLKLPKLWNMILLPLQSPKSRNLLYLPTSLWLGQSSDWEIRKDPGVLSDMLSLWEKYVSTTY